MEELIRLRVEDGIALVTLSRPKAYNSFNLPMVQLLNGKLITLTLERELLIRLIPPSRPSWKGNGNSCLGAGNSRTVVRV